MACHPLLAPSRCAAVPAHTAVASIGLTAGAVAVLLVPQCTGRPHAQANYQPEPGPASSGYRAAARVEYMYATVRCGSGARKLEG